MSKSYGIHWFRRDLRVMGNPALKWHWKQQKGRVLGFFCFDKNFLSRKDFSSTRFAFFLETMVSLKKELQSTGGDLLVLDMPPLEAFGQLLEQLKKGPLGLPQSVSWNRDYEPFARDRDTKLNAFFEQSGIEPHEERDHLLIEPWELTKKGSSDEGYQVYTPFSRQWLEIFDTSSVQNRVKIQEKSFAYLKGLKKGSPDKIFSLKWEAAFKQKKIPFKDALAPTREANQKHVSIEIPKAGTLAAWEKLDDFKKKLSDYKDDRDYPSIKGTSNLSIYFKNGTLTGSQVIAHLGLKSYPKKDKSSADCYFSELIWREFYYHILYRFPKVENQSFNPKYKNLKWENNPTWFEAWKEGKTGFPIVDAGMRELNQTGLMHNRTRMIVASFLTKDLLIDWRWGERYFMEKLLDGDLAPNNGGWQWAASTGCDAQPYFRIFNPWTQGLKFDPEATYIKTFVPELKDIQPKLIHKCPDKSHSGYVAPLVDHSVQREKTLKLYKA